MRKKPEESPDTTLRRVECRNMLFGAPDTENDFRLWLGNRIDKNDLSVYQIRQAAFPGKCFRRMGQPLARVRGHDTPGRQRTET